MTPIFALVLAALTLQRVVADSETTLLVPFSDPQAISAQVIGVDAALTRTTYQLEQGAYTGTWTDPQGSFPGTATLVEGADYASFTYVVNDPDEGSFTVGGVCSFSGGTEVCEGVEVDTDGPVTFTTTDSAVLFGLEIAAATGTPASGAPASGTSTSGSGANAGSSAGGTTPSATGSAPTSSHSSSGVRVAASALVALPGLLLAACQFA